MSSRFDQTSLAQSTHNYANYRNILEILPGIRQGTGPLRRRPLERTGATSYLWNCSLGWQVGGDSLDFFFVTRRTSDFGRSLKELGRVIGLRKASELAQNERAEKTLLAIKECKSYLEDVEKELSRMSKKFSNKEIGQGVGFAVTGIHEALTYLAIVKRVIEKTERIVAKKHIVSDKETDYSPRDP